MKVLIIDDEEAVCNMYKIKLEMEGLQVFTALDGESGIEIIKKEKPDVVLLDIIMPRLNGFDVLKLLKEDKETKDIPVFLLTNLPQESGGEKGTELGAAGYLVKADYEPSALAKMIKAVAWQPRRDSNPRSSP
uniref:Response regulator n=1 Tax=candidate division CPR3 bacterium TaxID=2268181 RepID=A0A7V3JAD6_UNCC3